MSFFEPKTSKNQGIKAKQRGSAIVWILIMVALFAALTYTMSEGSRTGESQLGDQQAGLAATEILDYGRNIKNAVQQLLINGCSDTEISFENDVVAGYTNANAPTDKSCHVFHPNGGGMRYQGPNEDWLRTSDSAKTI